jgi:gliding-associated putative ABC transporter substrate-binding component GldG
MKKERSIFTQIILLVAVLVVVNILSDRFFMRLDFTADQRYTLSNATKNILTSLDRPVTVTAYFTEQLPPDLASIRRDFRDLLVEYANGSKGKVLYEFINPNESQETEQSAFQKGIQPVLVSTREKDQSTQKRVFMGAVIQLGDKQEIIPFIQPGSAMEYGLSTAIKKLTLTFKPLIGIVQGHGEPSLNAMPQVLESMQVLNDVAPVNLSDPNEDLNRFKTIVIVSPRDTIPSGHLQKLDQYLASGGRIFIAMDRVDGNLSTVQGTSIETGLERWLSEKGLIVENNFVIDANCGSVGVQQQQGFFNFTTNVRFPYLPIIVKFADHPITKGLSQVLMPFVSSISYVGDTAHIFQPIASSSEKSGTKTPPLFFDINKQWTDADFPMKELTVGAILKGKLAGNTESAIVLFSDGQFPVNGEGQRAQQLSPDNVSLMVNAIDYLSDDTGLIDLRTKGVTARPLDQVEEGKALFLKWLNFLLPIVIIIAYGIFRMQRRRAIRTRRMTPGAI